MFRMKQTAIKLSICCHVHINIHKLVYKKGALQIYTFHPLVQFKWKIIQWIIFCCDPILLSAL